MNTKQLCFIVLGLTATAQAADAMSRVNFPSYTGTTTHNLVYRIDFDSQCCDEITLAAWIGDKKIGFCKFTQTPDRKISIDLITVDQEFREI